ncbi:alpha/beta hydrolase [Qipengyuania marisflavi]|nr:alpha/beta hydrolase-fold protein [Qipengyuania marisflavi]
MLNNAMIAVGALMLAAPALGQSSLGEPVTIGTTYTIPSAVLGGERRITVRLPLGYVEQPEMRFPVVYVIDGGPEQDFPHIAGIVQSRDMNYSFGRFILVGVETVNRRAEISPPVRADALADYTESLGATPGGAAEFRRFLAQDVKPWVEQAYRTSGQDAVMGESLAGLFIIETLFEQPDLFDDWIAVSPSLWWDNMKLAIAAPARLRQAAGGKERLYLTLANEGYRHEEGVERMVDALRSDAPDDWQWAYVPLGRSETHGTIYHTAALDAFRLLYGTTTREYRPASEMLGREAAPRTAAEQAMLDTECTAQNTTALTPESAAMGRDRLFYRCLNLDLGPVAREGNLGE